MRPAASEDHRAFFDVRLLTLLSLVLLLGCGDSNDGPGADAAPGQDALTADAAPPSDADTPPDAGGPWVEILAPADGTNAENPVTFEVAAGGVQRVEIFADDWSLGPAWDPQASTTLTYTFAGLGFPRQIELRGYGGGGATLATDQITITVIESDIGTYFGEMWNTYYYLANEADYSGPDDTTLYDSNCDPITQVPADYSDDVCIEGSGILDDGTVINYASSCGCGRTCPTGGIVCYSVLDPATHPWGMGSFGNALEPLRSWAVDNSIISAGTLLYAEEWDGVQIPNLDGLGGYVHDGCFRADDVGGWITGYHYDFFAGTHAMWLALEGIFPTQSTFTVYVDPGKCAYLQ